MQNLSSTLVDFANFEKVLPSSADDLLLLTDDRNGTTAGRLLNNSSTISSQQLLLETAIGGGGGAGGPGGGGGGGPGGGEDPTADGILPLLTALVETTPIPPLMIEETDSICDYMMPYMDIKLILVVMLGTTVATVSILQNVMVFVILLHRASFRQSHLFYFIFLAVLDIVTALSYVMLMSVQIIMEYLESLYLSLIWHGYLRPMFAISHIGKSVSTFLLIAATTERYLVVQNRLNASRIRYGFRVKMIVSAFLLGFFFNVSSYYEVTSKCMVNCTNHNHYLAAPGPVVEYRYYKEIWMFYLRNIVSVFFPFIALLYMNTSVWTAARYQMARLSISMSVNIDSGGCSHRSYATSAVEQDIETSKRAVRNASRMLIVVVASYLLANALNVVVTAWEHLDLDGLYRNHPKFYSLAADVITLSTVACGMVRLEIYCWCNPTFRSDLRSLPRLAWCGLIRLCKSSTTKIFRQRHRHLAPRTPRHRNHKGSSPVTSTSTSEKDFQDPKYHHENGTAEDSGDFFIESTGKNSENDCFKDDQMPAASRTTKWKKFIVKRGQKIVNQAPTTPATTTAGTETGTDLNENNNKPPFKQHLKPPMLNQQSSLSSTMTTCRRAYVQVKIAEPTTEMRHDGDAEMRHDHQSAAVVTTKHVTFKSPERYQNNDPEQEQGMEPGHSAAAPVQGFQQQQHPNKKNGTIVYFTENGSSRKVGNSRRQQNNNRRIVAESVQNSSNSSTAALLAPHRRQQQHAGKNADKSSISIWEDECVGDTVDPAAAAAAGAPTDYASSSNNDACLVETCV